MQRVSVCLTGNYFAGGDEDRWQETVPTCAYYSSEEKLCLLVL